MPIFSEKSTRRARIFLGPIVTGGRENLRSKVWDLVKAGLLVMREKLLRSRTSAVGFSGRDSPKVNFLLVFNILFSNTGEGGAL
jgi:3-deoxy-D-arabino-heptulosonate 7-phosphate (DAHP) synthase